MSAAQQARAAGAAGDMGQGGQPGSLAATKKSLSLRRPLVSFDLETTGLDLVQDRVVEICCLKLLPSGERQSLVYRVNPGRPIPKAASAVHGITDQDVADAEPFAAVAPAILAFCRGADLTGFNIERFDIPMLRAEYQRLGQTFPLPYTSVLDSCRIFFQKEPRNLTAALKYYCKQDLVGAHGALADATAALDVLLAQVAHYDDLPVDVFALHEYCHPKKPEWIDSEGKLSWQGEQAVLTFGKHRNKPLEDLVRDTPDYLRWLVNDSNFSSEVKAFCQRVLAGEVVRPPAGAKPGKGQSDVSHQAAALSERAAQPPAARAGHSDGFVPPAADKPQGRLF